MDVTVVIVVDLEHLVAYEDGKANTECAFDGSRRPDRHRLNGTHAAHMV